MRLRDLIEARFDHLRDKKQITVYRVVDVDESPLNIAKPGNFWSFTKAAALLFADRYLDTINPVLLVGKVKPEHVDWEQSEHSEGVYSSDEEDTEDELYIPDDTKVSGIKAYRVSGSQTLGTCKLNQCR